MNSSVKLDTLKINVYQSNCIADMVIMGKALAVFEYSRPDTIGFTMNLKYQDCWYSGGASVVSPVLLLSYLVRDLIMILN